MDYQKLKDAVKNSPELRSHNLDMTRCELVTIDQTRPVRDATQADFGAEYHGFTGFERANKGSSFRRRSDAAPQSRHAAAWLMGLLGGGR